MNPVQVCHPILGESWPTSTKIACWHCCTNFDGPPVGVPHQKLKNGVYACHGVYCSWNCAKTGLHRDRKYYTGGPDRMAWLMHMAKKLSGLSRVTCAPPRELLDKFGGPLTIEQFRGPYGGNYSILRPPMIPLKFGHEPLPMPSWKGQKPPPDTVPAAKPTILKSKRKTMRDYMIRRPV